ncbi:MAG: pyruvate dehydrogenase (acetyl-transferring) E1 component subunit alpha [Deltaproteobacteria bacterium]|nr:pyruvate dehydrogenase (acetyl-transferring) E1 component subunit alpha [Deltaproteobacteria bacterium]
MPMETIASFEVARLNILDENGDTDIDLVPDLKPDRLVAMYRWMLLAREADQRMLKMQRQGRMGTFAPSTGQEAVSVAAAMAMGEKDWFTGAFRELGGRLVRGEPLVNVFLYYNGYEEGNLRPQGSADRLLPVNIIVGSQCVQAAGLGYAAGFRGEDAAVLTVFGDGATSEGDFHEGMNLAAVWNAPVVFLCQNNQWAISIRREKQTRSQTLAQKGIAYGMPCVQVDGNDALAVYRAVDEALARARSGDGPTFIEAVTYRLMMHTTADDPTRYRTEEEAKEWWDREPLVRFRRFLEKQGLWDKAKQDEMDQEIKAEVAAAVEEFEARDSFKADAPFDHVFGTDHAVIQDQRREFLARLEEVDNAQA